MVSSLSPVCVTFQGGGALGMAHLGAWQVLARRFHVVGTAGTSAGSIVAALCAAGYDPAHAIDLFHWLEWPEQVKRQSWIVLFRKRDGWSDGERFYQWMKERLAARLPGQPQHVSFSSLYQETDIYLAIIACDLNNHTARPVLFDAKSEPDTSVAFAVRASISIPGLFVAVPRRDRGQILVDGGLLLNLPVEPLHQLAQRKQCPLIGVRFEQTAPYLDSPTVREVLMGAIGVSLTPGSLPPSEIARGPNYIDIIIDVGDFDSLNFKLNREAKEELVRRGVQAAERALLEYDVRMARSSTGLAPSVLSDKSAQVEDAVTEQPLPNVSSVSVSQTTQSTRLEPEIPPEGGQTASIQNQPIKLSDPNKDALVNILLKYPCISDSSIRESVVRRLPEDIRRARIKDPRQDIDVENIVNTCNDFPGGIESLIAAVRVYGKGTWQIQEIDSFLHRISSRYQ